MARKKFRNFTIGAILFLSLVAIVITGFGTGGSGGLGALSGGGNSPSGNELAKVGRVAITADQANNQFNQDFQQLRQNLPNVQITEFLSQGGFEGSVDRLIALEALSQYARAHGIVATRRMVDHAISTAAEFQFARVGNTFDNNIFQSALQRAGVSVEQIRSEYGRRLLQQQLLLPVMSGYAIPQGVAAAYATVPREQRTGMIGVVPVGAIERSLNPTEAELNAYYQRYRDYFTVPERRVIKYALIGPDQITITPPTDAEIQAVYNATPRYQAGRIRTLESLNFGLGSSAEADAATFAQRVRGGTGFQQAAQAAGRGDAYVRRANQTERDFANLVTPQVATQAFSAQQGAIIGPVRSPLGWLVVRVDTAAAGQPLERVRADIVRELERRKRAAAIASLATRIEQQIEEGMSFEDAARGAHLAIVTSAPLTAQGRLSNGQAAPNMAAELRALLPAAFEMEADASEPQVAALDEGARYALLGIERSEAAAPPPLAEIRALVRGQLVRRTALRRARQIADAIAARINGGMAPVQAFASAGLPLPPPQPITAFRQNAMARQAPDSLKLFFRLRPGTAAVIAAPNNGGWMVAAPQQSIRGSNVTPTEIASIRAELNQAAQNEVQEQLLKAMEQSIGVQRNLPAIQAERRRIAATMTSAPQPAQ
jgi:peptidyl-prolyl cis-trans isomerase D